MDPSSRDRSRRAGARYHPPAVVLFFALSLVFSLLSPGGALEGQLLRLRSPTLEAFLTSHLLHPGGYHLTFTLLIMLVAGGVLETRWGTPVFVSFYLFTAWGTTLVTLLSGLAMGVDGVICGASGAAIACAAGVGLLLPDERPFGVFPPVKHLAWIAIFLAGAGLAALRMDAPGGTPESRIREAYFLLPQVSGAAFALLFIRLRPSVLRIFAGWRAHREEGRRVRVHGIRLRVDELLEKISTDGYESLSPDEKVFLRQASKHFRNE